MESLGGETDPRRGDRCPVKQNRTQNKIMFYKKAKDSIPWKMKWNVVKLNISNNYSRELPDREELRENCVQ